jgi:peptidyl-prolyl cis-trans isomerase B (cyclophilin B)
MKWIGSLAILLSAMANGQISVGHPYNGIGRPLTVTVRAPKVAKAIQIELLEPLSAKVVEKASVSPGSLDLAKLFPELWATKKPQLLYAQLTTDGKKLGPAVVLQPMLNPLISRLAADGKTVEFVPDEDGPKYNGIRAYVDEDIVFDTSKGIMRFRMRPDAAPNTVWNIMQLVKGGLYTETIFHRIVSKRPLGPFVIQGGDPTGTGSGGAGFSYPLEKSPLPHDFGVISIARSTDPNTNGCQIFVALSRAATAHLDGRYAAFGQAILGAPTILKIATVPIGKDDRPTNPPVIHRAYLAEAKPYGEGPQPVRWDSKE